MSLLELRDISKEIQGTMVLRNVSITLNPFQKIAIAGGTGSGKTTLLKIAAGLIKPDDGEVLFEGRHLPGPDEKLIPGHPAIAFLSQHFELRNNYRVEEILEYANLLSDEQAEALYDICRVRHLLKRRTDELSGGEKQRIATTRLLLTSPRLFLLDEPFSNLDMFHRQVMKEVIEAIGERLKITCILVSHEPADILPWADEVLILMDGEIIQQGNPADVYYQPVNEYAAALLGVYNVLPGALYKSLGGIDANKKEVILRPERLCIGKNKRKGLKAVVQKIAFLGSYFETDVLIGELKLKVRTTSVDFSIGDKVSITIDNT